MVDDLRGPYQAGSPPSLLLGGIILNDKLLDNAPVNLVLKSFNRHGLIAGATGTGKTKTMQALCEQLSLAGVPSLVMDIKGDISGLGEPGTLNEVLKSRVESLHLDYTPQAFPVELFTLNESIKGVPLRSTVGDFGPLLFSRMLALNDTQAGVITILFEYAKNRQLPLRDLDDVKTLLQYMQSPAGKSVIQAEFGSVSSSSVGAIMRKIIELESQGGEAFFGEPAFQVNDLLRTNNQGQGIISIVRLMDMQDKPQLFSTFMLKLLTDVYRQLPELGDPLKPKLVLFIDEAHLIFNNASKALLNLLDTMVKLIRSKGVGLIFCTQTPNDIPPSVLSQLGLKIQHALRAFTAKDRQAMKLVAQNFPPTTHYQTETLLTSLSIGDALVSALDEKGEPTPLIECRIRPPASRMGVLTDLEVDQLMAQSFLYARYSKRLSHPPLSEQLNRPGTTESTNGQNKTPAEDARTAREKKEPSMVETLSKNTLVRQIIRDLFRNLMKILTASFKKK